jgi:hypothetical protein
MSDIFQPPTTPPAPPPPKRKKPASRAKRWAEAVESATEALNNLFTELDTFAAAMEELRSVQEEYEGWKDNLPENLASSPLGEKLEEVCSLDIEGAADNIRNALDEVQGNLESADGIDLPQGFGRD